ncbi:hypothetical protein BEL04_06290 [Mucilaginibacter sp. PPCGB 2223]|uniref:hypothetical protein n=1 Tax=Mucilaginibacter sp. PPCGB 2223 TaxID=1886027 RepID=UPI0008248DC5|nr:hypothetical protein [Mucilaginibacter sp. PPCGB 2223]OCX53891.1 hypothetical protein BEL04_06290 [Mucilaginibacter sp. PPCGB 2223]
MKAVAYSVKAYEKEYLARANRKKHDITLISNPLSVETVAYAKGKDAVIVFTDDDVWAPVIEKLALMGIRFIVTRTAETDHIDRNAALRFGIKISNVPGYAAGASQLPEVLQQIADQTISNLDLWQNNKCVGDACACARNCRTNAPNI